MSQQNVHVFWDHVPLFQEFLSSRKVECQVEKLWLPKKNENAFQISQFQQKI